MLGMDKLTTEQKIMRAKIQMYKDSPFFAYILLHMKITEKSKEIPTMGVDNRGNLYYNKDFVDSLSERKLVGVIAHETMHMALMHMERLGTRDPQLMNIAEDLVVNDILTHSNFELPEAGVIPTQSHEWTFKGHTLKKVNEKSAEEVYDELYPLMDKIKVSINNGDKETQGFDEHKHGGSGQGNDETETQSKHRQDNWKKVVAEASALAKQQGKLPAGLERMIEKLLDSKIPWRQELYRYVIDQLIFDYSWCVEKNTEIKVPDFTDKPICSIKEGDEILGVIGDRLYPSIVKKVFKKQTKKKYVLYSKTGKRLVCSGEHKILTIRGYIKAKDLNIGDIIITL